LTSALPRFLLLVAALAPAWAATSSYVYVGRTTTRSAIIAWGTTRGGVNTIGRNSVALGDATLELNGRHTIKGRNWMEVDGLNPDTEYPYSVTVNGRRIGAGTVHTLPERAASLRFFVIGDFGTGAAPQQAIARAMWIEYKRLATLGQAVRFVLTTGDNIYGSTFLGIPLHTSTGDDDSHWDRRFFSPYAPLLAHVPFYPTLGNHDGNESETAGDLPVYLDNFFFPGNAAARYYSFTVGGLVDFFALDTTVNSYPAWPVPGMSPASSQYQWLKQELAHAHAPWRIAYGHHPPITAGPSHPPSWEEMKDIVGLFKSNKVAAYFCGHEHNFQLSTPEGPLSPTRMFLTGAGGELRPGDIRSKMRQNNIALWAPAHHFLSVEIDADVMRVQPISYTNLKLQDADGRAAATPIVIRRP
jgi:hypothetical protein